MRCGADFVPRQVGSKFCSQKCRSDAWEAEHPRVRRQALDRLLVAVLAHADAADRARISFTRLEAAVAEIVSLQRKDTKP